MPAETHTHRDAVDLDTVSDFLAMTVGVEADDAARLALSELDLAEDLALLDLWTVVAEEFGERSLGKFELVDPRPTTLAELAVTFHASLST